MSLYEMPPKNVLWKLTPKKFLCKFSANEEMCENNVYVLGYLYSCEICFFGGASLNFLSDGICEHKFG